jgi:hypothetical protein
MLNGRRDRGVEFSVGRVAGRTGTRDMDILYPSTTRQCKASHNYH